ncbi:MAG: phosphoglucosamine mutase [Myxococcota bacterium]|nr:phosphoglucosamine mutase [Myxococcota bacterium]
MKRQFFGTDGVRGLANRWPMTGEMAMALGRTLTHGLRTTHRPRILIGKDTRRSCYMLETALAAGICSAGGDALLLGPIPTPAVAFLVKSMRADGGVMISASHNAFADNGIKLFGSDGYKFDDAFELRLEQGILDPPLENELPVGADLGRLRRLDEALGRYIVFAKTAFPPGMTLEGLKVAVDCANGAAYKVAPTALEELGAEVIAVGTKPDGANINDGVGSMYPENLGRIVREQGCHVGLCLDGDADRLIVVDEKGNTVDGDQLMAINALRMLNEGRLAKNTLVSTVMSNLALDRCLESAGGRVLRTQVGDRYVVGAMRQGGYNLGGEQSGHLIFLDHSTTGDGLVAGLGFLGALMQSDKTVSELASVLQPFPQSLVNVPVREKLPLEELAGVQKAIRAGESELGVDGRVLVRYSGTENKARVLVEGRDSAQVQRLAEQIGEALKTG